MTHLRDWKSLAKKLSMQVVFHIWHNVIIEMIHLEPWGDNYGGSTVLIYEWTRCLNKILFLPRTSVRGTMVALWLIHRIGDCLSTLLYCTLSVCPTTRISTTSSRIALKFGRHNLRSVLRNIDFFVSIQLHGRKLWYPKFWNFRTKERCQFRCSEV